jgi:hypothetical protein
MAPNLFLTGFLQYWVRVYSSSRDMDKEKMADMSGHCEVDRAGSNSESFFPIFRHLLLRAVSTGQPDSARLSS